MRRRIYDNELTEEEFKNLRPISNEPRKGRSEGRYLTRNARKRLWEHLKKKDEFVREVYDHRSQRIMDRDKDEEVVQIVVQESRGSKKGKWIDVCGEETLSEVVWLLGKLEVEEVRMFLCKSCLKLLKLCDCGKWR